MRTLRKLLAVSCVTFMINIAAAWAAPFGQGQASTATSGGTPSTDDVRAALFKDPVLALKKSKKDKGKPGALTAQQVIEQNASLFIEAVAAPSLMSLPLFRSEVQAWRTDVQTESPSSSAGSTSLVGKGSVPSLLGLAVENGALTQSTSGTSVTFRTNPAGMIKALQKYSYAESGPNSYQDPLIKLVSKASAAITFNTGGSATTGGQGSQTPGVFTGNAQQISSFDFRYDLFNHRDPRDKRYDEKWISLRDGQAQTVADAARGFEGRIKGTIPYDPLKKKQFDEWAQKVAGWVDMADENAADTAPNSVQSVVYAIADDFVKTFGDDPDVRVAKDAVVKALTEYLKTAASIRNLISKSPIVTLEYTDARQGTTATMMSMAAASAAPAMPGAKLPDLTTFKFIVAGGTVGGATLTANASVTLFNSNPQAPDKGRVRDFQLSGQVDVPLREIQSIGVPTLTFAGLFLSLREQPLGIPVQVNGVNVNLKGNMGFAQAKISFPVKKGSGVNVPLSITYASRTELNKEHDVRGSVGMTLDLDTIFAGLKP